MKVFSTHRRQLLGLLGGSALAAGWPAAAQSTSARRYATMSLVGDMFTVVERREVTGTRLNRNGLAEVPVGSNIIDRALLGVVNQQIVKADPAAKPLSLLVDEPVLYTKQKQLFDGGFVRLPTALIKVARDGGATHVLLLTKAERKFGFKMLDGNPGQGAGDGLGFYIEPSMMIRSSGSGEVAQGFLGVFAHMRASIVDLATEAIVADRAIADNDLYLATGQAPGAWPWDSLSAADKLKAISNLAMNTVREQLPALLASR